MDAYADALGIAEPAAPKAKPATSAGNPALASGRDDLLKTLEGLQSTLADVKEGSPTHQRTMRDIAAIQEQLGKMPGGSPASSPAPVSAAPKADPYADALGLGASAPAPVATAPKAVPPAPRPATQGAVAGRDGAAYSTDPTTDLTAGIVSGMAAPVAAGVHGGAKFLWELVKGNGVDKAVDAGVDAVHSTQDALTYRPRTEQGQKMLEQFGSKYNPVNWIPNATSWMGEKSGDAIADAGLPSVGAVVKGAGAAAPVAIGASLPKVVPVGTKMLSDLVKPQEVARVAEPTLQGKPRYRLGPDGQPVLIDQPLPQPGSGGAAVAVPAAPAAPAAAPVVTKPTVAQASPELQKVVQQAQTKGKPLNQPVLDRHLEADTLPVKVQLTEGQARLDPELISMEMNGRGKAKPTVSPDFYNQQGKALAQNLDVLRERASPNVTGTTHAEHGQVLVDEYKAMDSAARADINAKYKALEDANGGALPLSGSDFVSAADAALKKINRDRFLPGEVKTMLNDYREGGSMTFGDFENLRTILAAEGRKAARAGDGNAEAAISAVRESLESLPMSQETSGIKPLADAARKAAKARFDRIKADPAYKAVVGDDVPAGEPSPLADKFVQNYIVNGKGAHVKNMKVNLSGSQMAGETISRASLDYLADMAKADKETGKFLADKYNQGVRQLGPKLGDVFDPETRATVEQLGRVSKYTSAQPKGSYVNNSNSTVAAAAEMGKSAIEGAVNNAAFGIPIATFVRKGVQNRAETKAAKRSTAPGAGIDSTD